MRKWRPASPAAKPISTAASHRPCSTRSTAAFGKDEPTAGTANYNQGERSEIPRPSRRKDRREAHAANAGSVAHPLALSLDLNDLPGLAVDVDGMAVDIDVLVARARYVMQAHV